MQKEHKNWTQGIFSVQNFSILSTAEAKCYCRCCVVNVALNKFKCTAWMWPIDNLCNHLTGFTSTSKSFSMDLLPDGHRIWGIVTFAIPVNIYLSTITYYFFLPISRLRRQKPSMPQAPITSTRFQTRLHRVGELIKVGARFYMKRHANQYLTSISIGKQYFPFLPCNNCA